MHNPEPDPNVANLTCPNCSEVHTDLPDVCVLSVLAGILVYGRERDVDKVLAGLEKLDGHDVDELWDYLSPALDRLEDLMELNPDEEDENHG
jgi:hypothetical protein